MKYRKKPVVIEAVQYTSKEMFDIETAVLPGWLVRAVMNEEIDVDIDNNVSIKTLEGVMNVSIGDWILKGIAGEFYPCKPDIFEATYDAID